MMANITTRAASPMPIRATRKTTSPAIRAPHCLLVQVAIYPSFLELSGSLGRDFDVLDGDALFLEHPPDVLPGARRQLGEVARRRHLYAGRDEVVPILGGQRDRGRLGANLPGRALRQRLDRARRDHRLLARAVVHDRAPRYPPAEGELAQEQQQRDQRDEDADHREHDAHAGGEVRDGEVAEGLDRAPVARVGVYHVRRDGSEGHEQYQHGDRHEQQGDYEHDDAVESVHCTLVLVWRGSASTSLTLSLLTGTPRWASRSEERRVGHECRSRWSP